MKHILLLVGTTFFLNYPLEASLSKEEFVEGETPKKIQYTRDKLLYLQNSPLSKLPLHIDLNFYTHPVTKQPNKGHSRKRNNGRNR